MGLDRIRGFGLDRLKQISSAAVITFEGSKRFGYALNLYKTGYQQYASAQMIGEYLGDLDHDNLGGNGEGLSRIQRIDRVLTIGRDEHLVGRGYMAASLSNLNLNEKDRNRLIAAASLKMHILFPGSAAIGGWMIGKVLRDLKEERDQHTGVVELNRIARAQSFVGEVIENFIETGNAYQSPPSTEGTDLSIRGYSVPELEKHGTVLAAITRDIWNITRSASSE